jgi:hypothetical protein
VGINQKQLFYFACVGYGKVVAANLDGPADCGLSPSNK